jgi:hypothetical protein
MLTLAQAATATATAVATKAAEDPKWTEVAGFWVTLAAALITLSAVLVALFGPGWQARRRTPRLSLVVENTALGMPVETETFLPIRLRVSNTRGRDTARNVQLYITVDSVQDHDGSLIEHIYAEDDALRFDDPLRQPSEKGIWSTDVPSGHSRPVWFAMMGSGYWPWTKGIPLDGGPKLYLTVDGDWFPPMSRDQTQQHDVKMVLTGDNFDAIHYTAVIKFSEEHEERDLQVMTLRWVHAPKQIAAPK